MHSETTTCPQSVTTMRHKRSVFTPIRNVVFLLNVCTLFWGCSPDEDSRFLHPQAREVGSCPPSLANKSSEELIAKASRDDKFHSKSVNPTAKPLMPNGSAIERGQSVAIDIVPFEVAPGQVGTEMVLERNVVFNRRNSSQHNARLEYKNHRSGMPCILSDRLAE